MKRVGWVVCVVLALGAPAFAEEAKEVVQRHSAELGYELYYHNYEEPGVMEEDGLFHGIVGAYEYHRGLYARAEVRGAWGEVDYASPVSGTVNGIDDWLFESRLLGGYDFKAGEPLFVTPFFGLGWRYLNDDSAGKVTTTGALGYERESNYVYSPLGLAVVHVPKPGWRLRASSEFDLFWFGKQTSHLSQAVSGVGDLKNDQDSGYGVRGNIGVEKKGKTIDWWLDGFLRYWDIDDSDLQPVTYLGTTIGLGYEPKNDTVEVGGAIGLRF